MTLRFPASLHVYTFREGLLSRLGHDLRLSFDRFAMTSKEGLVTAQVGLDSLRVDGAMHDGKLDTQQLDAGDRAKITASALADVLLVKRFPDARFEGRAMTAVGRYRVAGMLSLHGEERPLELSAEQVGRELVLSATLTPSSFGIAPFRALAGTIRVQDRVRVELRTAWPEGQTFEQLASASLELSPMGR